MPNTRHDDPELEPVVAPASRPRPSQKLQREAQQLRANLARRKQQARERENTVDRADDEAGRS